MTRSQSIAAAPETPEPVPLEDGRACLWRQWVSESRASRWFEHLRDELAWEQPVIRVYGRHIKVPRLTAWYGDPGAGYTYSGRAFSPRQWTPTLLEVKSEVEATTSVSFNGVLANYYRDGRDSVSWHSDAEAELGPNPVIASVSLGSERKFTMKHRSSGQRVDLWLPTGSLLLMTDETQHYWVHQLPKTKKNVGPRINLTFRLIRG